VAYDGLDDVADWGEGDGLDEGDDLLDDEGDALLDDEADLLAPRRRTSGNLGFVLTCANRQRQQRFRLALRRAIWLARNAASRLTAPRMDQHTRNMFVRFFATSPGHRPPWAAPRTAGALVAHRLRRVAEELGGGRRFRYTCVSGNVGACEPPPDPPGTFIIAATTGKSAITLCDRFFTGRTIDQMAGTLIHEGLHAIYWDLFDHSVRRGAPSRLSRRGTAECRRDNSYCLQSFALRVANRPAEDGIQNPCRRTPAECRRLVERRP